ncbi:MAG TPA: hypothetical protein DCS43_03895 [Verrucomicrobia bacterium]|nr:hypothetical protein [Verrucomicrobiota bacterium]
MKTAFRVAMVMLACSLGAVAGETAQPGVWTQDIDAAKVVAKEKAMPILLNFTGSDWCSWCKVMDKNVFSQPEWDAYATDKLLLVKLDFPRDKSLVPAAYVPRNEELKTQFDVAGFPTYVLLDGDGETELGRLGSGKDKTPASFAQEVDRVLRFSKAGIAAYLATLSPEDKGAYEVILNEMLSAEAALRAATDARDEAIRTIGMMNAKVEELKAKTAEFRAAKSGPDTLKEYQAVKAELATARKTLEEWLATAPKPTPELRVVHGRMVDEVQRLEEKLASF